MTSQQAKGRSTSGRSRASHATLEPTLVPASPPLPIDLARSRAGRWLSRRPSSSTASSIYDGDPTYKVEIYFDRHSPGGCACSTCPLTFETHPERSSAWDISNFMRTHSLYIHEHGHRKCRCSRSNICTSEEEEEAAMSNAVAARAMPVKKMKANHFRHVPTASIWPRHLGRLCPTLASRLPPSGLDVPPRQALRRWLPPRSPQRKA